MRIVAAAVKLKTGAVVTRPPPCRHPTLFLDIEPYGTQGSSFGFLTSKGTFVSREEAMVIARAAKQLLHPNNSELKLFTEELW